MLYKLIEAPINNLYSEDYNKVDKKDLGNNIINKYSNIVI